MKKTRLGRETISASLEWIRINAVHAEPGAPGGREISSMLAETIDGLSDFIGAKEVAYKGPVPAAWKSALR